MKRIYLIIIILVFASVKSASAMSYSLVNDWSDLTNPNGSWSYNEGNNPLQLNVGNWPTGEFGPTQSAWANTGNPADGFTPAWFKSVIDPNSIGAIGPYDWQVGDVVVHTTSSPPHGANHGPASVTWISPITGAFNLNGGLWSGRDIGRSNDWGLYLDNSFLVGGSLFSGDIYSRINPNSFNLSSLYIQQGSVLKLEVARTTGLQGAGDFVGVNFDIAPVPEPATMLLFGSGMVGAFLRRRKK